MHAGNRALRSVLLLNWRDPWHPEGGGSELYLDQVTHEWQAAGIDVTWFTAGYPGRPRDERVGGIRYLRRGGHMTVYLWAAWLLLTRGIGRYDAVLEVQNGMPFLATWFTRTPVTVLVHHVHREQWSVVGPLLARVGWFLESRVAVRANRHNNYIAVSNITRDELITLGVDAESIRVAHNALPPHPDPTPPGPRATAPTVVVLSRLVPHKRVEHAIEAVSELVNEFPDIRLRIMGDGWWAANLRRLTESRGLTEQVTFLGHVDDREKFTELSRAWVHVLPSVKEGWGLAIVEAGSMGTTSIAYREAGGVRESILDGVTGLLAENRDHLVKLIASVLREPRLRDELGDRARTRAREFTWSATASTIADTLVGPANAQSSA